MNEIHNAKNIQEIINDLSNKNFDKAIKNLN